MRPGSIFILLTFALVLTSCQAAQARPVLPPTALSTTKILPTLPSDFSGFTETPIQPTIGQISEPQKGVQTPIVPSTATPTTPTPLPTLGPDEWQELPIIPVISETSRNVYLRGLELGNNPQAFSKIGDCGSTPAWFLGDFDRGSKYYQLGEFQYLQPVIEAFNGSYSRTSLAAKSGFNASSVFATLWSDRSVCAVDESPIACECRLNRPIAAFITLGSNDVFHQESFEPQMRKIIEFSIEQGIIPILATKADNEEKDGSINAMIANLAIEYDLPLWNYWRAVQPLPDHGLQEDGVHLTWGPNRFDDPQVMTKAWTIRNLTALQTLDAVWRYITDQPQAQP